MPSLESIVREKARAGERSSNACISLRALFLPVMSLISFPTAFEFHYIDF